MDAHSSDLHSFGAATCFELYFCNSIGPNIRDGLLQLMTRRHIVRSDCQIKEQSKAMQNKHLKEVGGVKKKKKRDCLLRGVDTRAPDLPGTTFPAERAFFRHRRTADGCKQNDELRHHLSSPPLSLYLFYCCFKNYPPRLATGVDNTHVGGCSLTIFPFITIRITS